MNTCQRNGERTRQRSFLLQEVTKEEQELKQGQRIDENKNLKILQGGVKKRPKG